MTKIDLQYTYGKEIDDLVAQYVMGWKLHKVGYWGVKEDETRDEFKNHPETREQIILSNWWKKHAYDYSSVGDYWIDLDGGFVKPCKMWTPSTDIEQAYKALRSAMRVVPQSDMHIEHLLGTGWCCSTCFDEDEETKWKISHSFDTLPQAMCAVSLFWRMPKDIEIVWPKGVLLPDDNEEDGGK